MTVPIPCNVAGLLTLGDCVSADRYRDASIVLVVIAGGFEPIEYAVHWILRVFLGD
jgi:hypothetical protein